MSQSLWQGDLVMPPPIKWGKSFKILEQILILKKWSEPELVIIKMTTANFSWNTMPAWFVSTQQFLILRCSAGNNYGGDDREEPNCK